jgi:amino acid permease
MVWYLVLWTGLIWQIIQACFGRNSTEPRSRVMLWLVILAFLVMHSAYWTDTRMRAPVMPIMIVISVAGWQSVSTYFYGRAVAGKT